MRRSFVTDHSQISRLFRARAIFAGILSFLMIAGLLTRLGWLQIVEYAHFADLSKENRVRLMALPPNRGLIYDRNGVILAENRPTYHLELIPEQVEDIDATLEGLGEIVTIRRTRFSFDRPEKCAYSTICSQPSLLSRAAISKKLNSPATIARTLNSLDISEWSVTKDLRTK